MKKKIKVGCMCGWEGERVEGTCNCLSGWMNMCDCLYGICPLCGAKCDYMHYINIYKDLNNKYKF